MLVECSFSLCCKRPLCVARGHRNVACSERAGFSAAGFSEASASKGQAEGPCQDSGNVSLGTVLKGLVSCPQQRPHVTSIQVAPTEFSFKQNNLEK